MHCASAAQALGQSQGLRGRQTSRHSPSHTKWTSACFTPWKMGGGGRVPAIRVGSGGGSPVAVASQFPASLRTFRGPGEAAGTLLVSQLSVFPECSLDRARCSRPRALGPVLSLEPPGSSILPFFPSSLKPARQPPPQSARRSPGLIPGIPAPAWKDETWVRPLSQHLAKVPVSFLSCSQFS